MHSQVYILGGGLSKSANSDLNGETVRHLQRTWACFRRLYHRTDFFDRPGACLRLKLQLLIAERGSLDSPTGASRGTRTRPITTSYASLPLFVPLIPRLAAKEARWSQLSYADKLAKTACESTEATVRRRCSRVSSHVGEEHLPKKTTFGELVGGKTYPGRQEKEWVECLKNNLQEHGIKFEGWREKAQKADRHCSEFSCGDGITGIRAAVPYTYVEGTTRAVNTKALWRGGSCQPSG